MTEERHTYELVEMLDHGNVVHLRCPTCSKEVVRTLPPPDATESTGYRVLRDEHGDLLQGNFNARHTWATGIALDIEAVTP